MRESNLTRRLKKCGFLCGIESYVYYRTIGHFTTLYVEGEKDETTKKIVYSFYKMRIFPNGKSSIKVYCDRVDILTVVRRVDSYALYLKDNKNKTGHWFT
ncbi:hypothetical protein [Enterococcus sp. AZ072]|uniref:hypothetical protein n=1 Tax=unclassified Enterococcus TaxID=2608891 RepID=UPI003D2C21DA